VPAADFAAWVAHQQSPAAFGATAPAAAPAAGAAPGATTTPPAAAANRPAASGGEVALASAATLQTGQPAPSKQQQGGDKGAHGASAALAAGADSVNAEKSGNPLGAAAQGQTAALTPAQAYMAFPREKLQKYNIPGTPLPEGLTFNDALKGDPTRGQQAFMIGGCVGCHAIKGNPMAVGNIGPNLTHVGSRYTIAGAMYPNDTRHLARWIKNARLMKPGSQMPTLGKGQFDPVTKAKAGILDDQQIADVVAYLQALK
jgi:cytochrome c oxidase subunit 2